MAAHDLVKAGYSVCMLESSAKVGGRIETLQEEGFDQPVETGAEFVHGKLPLTLHLLDTAGIQYLPLEGDMIEVQDGEWKTHESHDEHWSAFMRKLSKLKADISIAGFLDKEFAEEKYAALRNAVRRYAEGFDLADIHNASALAAQREWSKEEEVQYRIPNGYGQLIDYLLSVCRQMNFDLFLNTSITKIEYNEQGAAVYCQDNRFFTSTKVIVTVSAGVMQSGNIRFDPIPDATFMRAFQQLGFGDVIKFLLQFDNAFWRKQSNNTGFILSNEAVPTWWTQLPLHNNLLTGWLGGSNATKFSEESTETLLGLAIQSLSSIFKVSENSLQQQLLHHRIDCWHNHPHVKGGYSYVRTDSANAKKLLSHPVADVLFFAGEALYQGESQGTVEAALQSGRETAGKIKTL